LRIIVKTVAREIDGLFVEGVRNKISINEI
jgi:hypothetical protein